MRHRRFKLPFGGKKKKSASAHARTARLLALFAQEPPDDDTDALIDFMEAWLTDAERFLHDARQDPEANPSETAFVEEARRQFRAQLWDLAESRAKSVLANQNLAQADERCRTMVAGWTREHVVSMMLAVLVDENTPDKEEALEPLLQMLTDYNPELLDAALEELNEITQEIKAKQDELAPLGEQDQEEQPGAQQEQEPDQLP